MEIANSEQILKDILNLGADYAKIFNPKDLIFSETIRGYCEENKCGCYGTNWMCPPGVGPISECKKEILEFENGVVFQTLTKIKGKDDMEGMLKGRDINNNFLKKVSNFIREKYKMNKFMPMGAGHCEICKRCAYLDNQPCRHPDKAISSAEAYGVDLGKLLISTGLKFNYSDDTIAYVSLVMWK